MVRSAKGAVMRRSDGGTALTGPIPGKPGIGDAAPAALPRKQTLGRLRDSVRPALGPVCEELAGLGLAERG